MTPPEPALRAPDSVQLDGDVPVLHLPDGMSVEELKTWLTEQVEAAALSDRTVRLHLGARPFVLLDVKRVASFLNSSWSLEVTAVYVRPGEAHRFAERQARMRFIVVPEPVEHTEELPVEDTLESEAPDTHEVTVSESLGETENTEVEIDFEAALAELASESAEAEELEEDEEAEPPTSPDLPEDDPRARRTLHITRTLRSGVSLRFDGDVVLIGDVNPGAEIVCSGNVHVWGACKGLVHAGALGDETCRVMALDLRPTQIRIGRRIALLEVREHMGVPEVARVDASRIRIEPFRARAR